MFSYSARKLPLVLFLLLITALLYIRSTDTSLTNNSTMPPLRLAILEADTPQPQTRDRYGGYTGVFTALLDAAAQSMSPSQNLDDLVTIKGYDVVHDIHSYPALEDVDAVLITGSRHTAFDNDPWIIKLVEFAKKAIDSGRVRVVGVCFGHQIIGRAAGAKLGRSDKGWEVAVTEVDLTDKGKEIFGLEKMVSVHSAVFAAQEQDMRLTNTCFTAHPPDAQGHRPRVPRRLNPPRIQRNLPSSRLLLSRTLHHGAGPSRVYGRDYLRSLVQPTYGWNLHG